MQRELLQGNVRPGNASQIIFNDSIPTRKREYSVSLSITDLRPPVWKESLFIVILPNALGANLYHSTPFWSRSCGRRAHAELLTMMIFGNQVLRPWRWRNNWVKKSSFWELAHGGSLALSFSLGTDPSIAGHCFYLAPILLYLTPKRNLLSKPWGLQIARLVKGRKLPSDVEAQVRKRLRYWSY